MRLASYAPIDDLAAGLAPDRLLLTKAHDGALFQYDLVAEDVEWSVQLEGSPSVLHVEPTLGEVAVGNRSENTVDLVDATTGTWTGRVAFDLGLGSAGGREGGVVAPYSYDPSLSDGGTVLERMDLLMRNVGLVVSVNASSLEVFGHVVLQPSASPPLRLAVTKELETLVVHERELGLVEPAGLGDERVERLVATAGVALPLDVCLTPSGDVVVSSYDRVQLWAWAAAPRRLELRGELPLPAGTTWLATRPQGDQLLVVWTAPLGAAARYEGGFYDPATLAPGAQAVRPLVFDPGLRDFVGAASLREGPALFFGRGGPLGGPLVLTPSALSGAAEPAASGISRPRLSGVSPDGRYVVWLDEGAEEPMARLVKDDGPAFTGYTAYRLEGAPAGPAFDPSGQWFFLPVPSRDALVVVE